MRVAVKMTPSRKPDSTTRGYSARSSSSVWKRNSDSVTPAWLVPSVIPWMSRAKYGSSNKLRTRLGITRPITPVRFDTSERAAAFGA